MNPIKLSIGNNKYLILKANKSSNDYLRIACICMTTCKAFNEQITSALKRIYYTNDHFRMTSNLLHLIDKGLSAY